MISRRSFVAGALAGACIPIFVHAQQGAKIAKIGVLSPAGGHNPISDAFEQALQELGWAKDQNIRIESRYAAGKAEALGPFAGELAGLGVDVLVAWSPAAAIAAKRAASQIPMVFLAVPDPDRLGLVSSLARPGGNVTGITFDASPEIAAKKLQLLKEAVPSIARVALLVSASETLSTVEKQTMAAAARGLKVEIFEVLMQSPAALEAAVRSAKDQGAQGAYVWPSALSFLFGKQLSELALAHRLPSIHSFGESAMAGGLISYAPSLTDIARRGAAYVDKILRGAKPAMLPVEQPIKFELVINVKTAKALGLSIPQSLLLRADRGIE